MHGVHYTLCRRRLRKTDRHSDHHLLSSPRHNCRAQQFVDIAIHRVQSRLDRGETCPYIRMYRLHIQLLSVKYPLHLVAFNLRGWSFPILPRSRLNDSHERLDPKVVLIQHWSARSRRRRADVAGEDGTGERWGRVSRRASGKWRRGSRVVFWSKGYGEIRHDGCDRRLLAMARDDAVHARSCHLVVRLTRGASRIRCSRCRLRRSILE